jgi:hypothetical protein
MNIKNPADKNHPLFVRYLETRDAVAAAIKAQWVAYDTGGLEAFKSAHAAAKTVCAAAHDAEQAVYDAGLAFPPYWYITPREMASYRGLDRERVTNPVG